MNKNFTEKDIILKHETNVKSAFTAISMAGVLGLIYAVRYFINGNFDFHFSLSLPEMMLKLGHTGTVSSAAAYGVTAAFFTLYLFVTVLCLKNADRLKAALALYGADFGCLLFFMIWSSYKLPELFSPDLYIEVIIHIFVILFLSVGVYSHGKLKKQKKAA